MFKTSTLLAALLAAAAALPSAAAAAPIGAAPAAAVRIVSFADLDLSGAAGRARLDRRLFAAVRSVCGKAAPTNLRARNEIRECREETFAAALADRRLGEVYVAEFVPAVGAAGQR